ncbi:Zinc finger protein rsv2 [Colletotrichum fructicola]|nr:Zinc finger protein rsv2 [Colletotrichum fructicola]
MLLNRPATTQPLQQQRFYRHQPQPHRQPQGHHFYPHPLDVDNDTNPDDSTNDINISSISSSPLSTQSFTSQHYSLGAHPSSSFPNFNSSHLAVPRRVAPVSAVFDDSPYNTKPIGRFSHQRESSLSSLGSAGPASPFSHNTSNPQIAVTDSTPDGLYDMQTQDSHSFYQLAKAMPSHDNVYPNYNGLAAIPSDMSDHEDDRRRKAVFSSVPKLDRTMTDIYNDELYSPNFTITSASPAHSQMAMSPNNDVFAQRLNAANNQHLSAAQSPASSGSRDRSPFRQGSPLAPVANHEFGANLAGSRLRFNSARQMREQKKAERDAQILRQQLSMKSEPETPKTISPKDAMLEFHDAEGDDSFPLFPSQNAADFDDLVKSAVPQDHSSTYVRTPVPSAAAFPYVAMQFPNGVQIPQQYPFIAHSRQSHEQTPRLSSAESSSGTSEGTSSSTGGPLVKPVGAAADGGTYTCTYHGCTLRFETPALLQKHKREGHRQTQTLGGPRRPDASIVPTPNSLLNSQAGPHRCDRINPSTDTIHNARKQKVRCNLCTEEKTFSRADALTRHYRVCHPDVEFPGKHRRRGQLS